MTERVEKKGKTMTEKQAIILCEAFGVDDTLNDEEEVLLLMENNPDQLDALRALYVLAHPNWPRSW